MVNQYAVRLDEIIATHKGREGPLLPILLAVQDAFGHVPQEVIEPIAKALNIAKAEVHGAASFYHDLRDVPAGRHVIRLCRAEACQSMGASALAETALSKIGAQWGEVGQNGITIEAVYCLGLCSCAPAAQVNGQGVGRLTDRKLDDILKEVGA